MAHTLPTYYAKTPYTTKAHTTYSEKTINAIKKIKKNQINSLHNCRMAILTTQNGQNFF